MSDVDTIASEISLMVSGESHRVEILYLRSFSTGAHHRVAADLCSVFPVFPFSSLYVSSQLTPPAAATLSTDAFIII